MTHRIAFFVMWLTELNFFLETTTQRIVFSYVSKNRTLNWIRLKALNTLNTTQRVEPSFQCDAKSWTFFQYDSKNWTFFLNTTHRIEPGMWLQELNPSYSTWLKELNLTQELNFFPIWPKESNTLLNVTQRIEPSSQKDSKNWSFSKKDSKNLNLLEDSRLQELKLFLCLGRWNFFFQLESKN